MYSWRLSCSNFSRFEKSFIIEKGRFSKDKKWIFKNQMRVGDRGQLININGEVPNGIDYHKLSSSFVWRRLELPL